jgi:NAD(P)-dependent dehydrogenase (short-subunit alcohol dehydrogenase family)
MDTVSQAPLILITGGSRGVGAATARLAAAQGYDVAISFVSNESAALKRWRLMSKLQGAGL